MVVHFHESKGCPLQSANEHPGRGYPGRASKDESSLKSQSYPPLANSSVLKEEETGPMALANVSFKQEYQWGLQSLFCLHTHIHRSSVTKTCSTWSCDPPWCTKSMRPGLGKVASEAQPSAEASPTPQASQSSA